MFNAVGACISICITQQQTATIFFSICLISPIFIFNRQSVWSLFNNSGIGIDFYFIFRRFIEWNSKLLCVRRCVWSFVIAFQQKWPSIHTFQLKNEWYNKKSIKMVDESPTISYARHFKCSLSWISVTIHISDHDKYIHSSPFGFPLEYVEGILKLKLYVWLQWKKVKKIGKVLGNIVPFEDMIQATKKTDNAFFHRFVFISFGMWHCVCAPFLSYQTQFGCRASEGNSNNKEPLKIRFKLIPDWIANTRANIAEIWIRSQKSQLINVGLVGGEPPSQRIVCTQPIDMVELREMAHIAHTRIIIEC